MKVANHEKLKTFIDKERNGKLYLALVLLHVMDVLDLREIEACGIFQLSSELATQWRLAWEEQGYEGLSRSVSSFYDVFYQDWLREAQKLQHGSHWLYRGIERLPKQLSEAQRRLYLPFARLMAQYDPKLLSQAFCLDPVVADLFAETDLQVVAGS